MHVRKYLHVNIKTTKTQLHKIIDVMLYEIILNPFTLGYIK